MVSIRNDEMLREDSFSGTSKINQLTRPQLQVIYDKAHVFEAKVADPTLIPPQYSPDLVEEKNHAMVGGDCMSSYGPGYAMANGRCQLVDGGMTAETAINENQCVVEGDCPFRNADLTCSANKWTTNTCEKLASPEDVPEITETKTIVQKAKDYYKDNKKTVLIGGGAIIAAGVILFGGDF